MRRANIACFGSAFLFSCSKCAPEQISAGRSAEASRPSEVLKERLDRLAAAHDWQGLAEELERGISSTPDAGSKADLHFRLGGLLEDKFLKLVPALKHYQDAYLLNP